MQETMPQKVSLEDITALLLEKFDERNGDRLPPTAYYKLLHFVEKQLDDRDIEADIPMFWYMFGRVAATNTNSHVSIQTTSEGRTITCSVSPSDVTIPAHARRPVENGIDEGLDLYFNKKLDGLIRASYDDAPYEAQRVFLDLKTQLETNADQTQATLGSFRTDDDQVRSLVYEFVRQFPGEDFPECERYLNKWYRVVSGELDSENPDFEYVHLLTMRFWRLFCLELACRENTGLDPSDIARELSSVHGSLDEVKEDLKEWIHQEEKDFTSSVARKNKTARKAAEAIIAPQLGVEIGY